MACEGRRASRLPRVYGGARSGCTHAACAGERARDCRLGVGMRGVQRTRKMPSMFLTREVSQLSDWLKARASC